jgi:hypothetical protein
MLPSPFDIEEGSVTEEETAIAAFEAAALDAAVEAEKSILRRREERWLRYVVVFFWLVERVCVCVCCGNAVAEWIE